MDPLGEWQQAAELKYHSGSVHKLSWAHPEFGQVIIHHLTMSSYDVVTYQLTHDDAVAII
jgi:hypothetical protein